MNKNKRALISLIVVSTVFFLATIINMPFSIFTLKDKSTSATNTIVNETNSLSEETPDGTIHSFSMDTDQTISSQEALFSAQDDAIAGQTKSSASPNNSVTTEANNSNNPNDSTDYTNDGVSATPAITIVPTAVPESTETAAKDASTAMQKEAPADSADQAATVTAEDEKKQEKPEALYSDVGISVAKDYVNIRKEPSTEGEVLGKLYRGSAATILKSKDDWYYIESGSVTGYVKAEFLQTGLPDDEIVEKYGTQTAIVTADGLNVRDEKTTDSKKLTVIYQNEKYPVLKTDDEWVQVKIEDENITGYVMKEFVDFIVDFKEAVSKEEEQKLLQLQAEERAKKETEIKYSNGVSYTQSDVKLLACLVHAEAGTQSYEGKLAVANVVLNRVKSSKYPDSIKSVIYQSGQFSVARSGSLQKQLDNFSNYRSQSQLLSLKAAKDALEGANNIGTRLYFHSYSAAAKKGYTSKSTSVKLGGHLFW